MDAAEYWNLHAGEHLTDPNHWEANAAVQRFQGELPGLGGGSPNFLERFLKKYGPFDDMASICCGTGVLERHVGVLLPKARITGFDISEQSMAMACAQVTTGHVSYEYGDANNLDWRDKHFDAVFANGALHHVMKLERCLGHISGHSDVLYVNDYVGPSLFQWPDDIVRRAEALLTHMPPEFVRAKVGRTDPVALAKMDPSEAVRAGDIMPALRKFFDIVELVPRGGTLLAPVFGSGCVKPEALSDQRGLDAVYEMCRVEADLIKREVIPSYHVVAVCRPKRGIAAAVRRRFS